MNRFKSGASRVALAREIAGESMILLKNDGLLPLKPGMTLAVFGKRQVALHIGGSGSGDPPLKTHRCWLIPSNRSDSA